jgi:hypothetical protein
MIELPFVDMPDDYTRLLRVDMTSTSQHHLGLQSYIFKNPSLKGILNRILNRGEDIDINSHIKTLGWHGIRDRIMCYYVNFAKTKRHDSQVRVEMIDDITDLERSLRFSTVSGFSRIPLYGFYLQLLCIDDGLESIKDHPLYPNSNIMELLSKNTQRVINIDYLIIMLHHLIEFNGMDQMKTFIDGNFSFESLYLKMTEEQKELFCSNFLSYCASIGEKDLFISKLV